MIYFRKELPVLNSDIDEQGKSVPNNKNEVI